MGENLTNMRNLPTDSSEKNGSNQNTKGEDLEAKRPEIKKKTNSRKHYEKMPSLPEVATMSRKNVFRTLCRLHSSSFYGLKPNVIS